MELSIGEMLMIALVIIVLFGPNKLPQIARELGQGVRKMRSAVEDIKTEILKEGENPVSEIKKEIQKVKEAVQNANPAKDLNENSLFSQTNQASGASSDEESHPLKSSEDETYDEAPVSR